MKEKTKEFSLNIQNIFFVLDDEVDNDLENQLTKILIEAAVKVGRKASENRSNKLTQRTKRSHKEMQKYES